MHSSQTRILQCCLSQAWGGLEMVAFETAVRLHENGIPVLTLVWPDSPLARKLSAQGLRTLDLAPQHKYFSPATVMKIRQALKLEHITTVLVQQLRDLWFLVPALRSGGFDQVRLVGLAHMWIDARKKGPVHRWLYQRLYRLVALTPSHKQNLIEHLPLNDDQFAIIPNSVDVERFRPELRDDHVRQQAAAEIGTLLIGVVSRLDPKKGLLEVVAAADQLRKQKVPFKIAIIGSETVGEESFRAKLQSEITQRQLQSYVELLGHRANIETTMASLDVLLMPSPAETFGRVIIEAMASGVAVVASSGGGVKDIVDHRATGLLVPPGDASAMAQALKLYYDEPSLRRQMATNGLSKARKEYDLKIVDRALFDLLQ